MNALRHWWHDSQRQQETPKGSEIQQIFNQVGRKVLDWLSNPPGPRIWQTKDRTGHISWHIYDPTTARSRCLNSEQEVRMWLDEQYYRR